MVDSWQNATAKDTGQVFLLVTLLVILFLVPLVRIVSVKKLGALLVSDKRVERSKSGLLLRQMTPIGRFTLMSQTERNPSIISFFIALANQRGTKGVELEEFEKLWRTCIMNKHERFRCCVSDTGTTCCFKVLERPFGDYCKVLPHPYDSEEFKARVSNFLTSPMDIKTKLW